MYVSKLTIIGSDNGLSPDRCQAIIWTNAGILSIGPLGTKRSEILIAIHIFSFKKMHLEMSSGKWRPFCLGLNVFKSISLSPPHLSAYSLPAVRFLRLSHDLTLSWLFPEEIHSTNFCWNFSHICCGTNQLGLGHCPVFNLIMFNNTFFIIPFRSQLPLNDIPSRSAIYEATIVLRRPEWNYFYLVQMQFHCQNDPIPMKSG